MLFDHNFIKLLEIIKWCFVYQLKLVFKEKILFEI